MPQIDPVILQLKADMDQYRAELRSSTSLAEVNFKRQERAVKSLEAQLRQSSDAISGKLKGLGASLAGYFSGRELVGLLDSFTRLQNNLKVAGVNEERLNDVQNRLLVTAQKYGVGLESLTALFGKSTQAVSAFGASQEQVFGLADAVAASLKIQGTSAAEAQGALLQLAQALQTGTVRAEEFNSVNEGMYPLLKAAATGSDRFGGSVAKMRAAVLAGTLSSQQFFNAILAGAHTLEGPASAATLTLSGAFAALTNNLTVYIGEASKTHGVTQALAEALGLLANNLDTLIPALAVIGTVAFGRYAAGALLAGTALRTVAAYATIATTSLAGTALAAESAGAAIVAALGGPVGIAITAFALAIGYAITQSDGLTDAQRAMAKGVQVAADATKGLTTATDNLATAHGRARIEALALAKAERENTVQKLAGAKASLALADAELVRARSNLAAQQSTLSTSFGKGTGEVAASRVNTAGQGVRDATSKVTSLESTIIALEKKIASADKAIAAPPSVQTDPPGKKKKGRKGPDPEQITKRFNDQIARVQIDILRAMADLSGNLEDRAKAELESIEVERKAKNSDADLFKGLNAARKAQLIAENNKAAEIEKALVQQKLETDLRARAVDILNSGLDIDEEILRGKLDAAKTLKERRDLELSLLAIDYDRRKLALDQQLADEKDPPKRKAIQDKIDALPGAQASATRKVERDNAGPLAQYRRSLDDPATQVEQAVADKLKSVDDAISSAISEHLGIKDPLLQQLLSIFIQQVLLKPIYDAIANASGSGSGIGGLISSVGHAIFGRASGGYVGPNQMVRVNEQAGNGVELLRMGSQGGTVIPLGQVNTAVARPSTNAGGQTSVSIAIDARGAGPREVDMLNSRLDRLQRDLPQIIVSTNADYNQRTHR